MNFKLLNNRTITLGVFLTSTVLGLFWILGYILLLKILLGPSILFWIMTIYVYKTTGIPDKSSHEDITMGVVFEDQMEAHKKESNINTQTKDHKRKKELLKKMTDN